MAPPLTAQNSISPGAAGDAAEARSMSLSASEARRSISAGLVEPDLVAPGSLPVKDEAQCLEPAHDFTIAEARQPAHANCRRRGESRTPRRLLVRALALGS